MRSLFSRFSAAVAGGIRIWWLAPLIPALVVIPEFVQHIAEIRLGMFASKADFNALAQDPQRMVWGYMKIAGLVLSILAALRFWGARQSGQVWWDLRGIAWKGLLVAIVLLVATSLPGTLLESSIGAEKAGYVDLLLALATLPLIYLLVQALAGDGATTLRSAFGKQGWLGSVRLLIFAAALWIPLQWLHGMNHQWALGAPQAGVWALMIFDSIVVGLLATMAGSAIWHGARGSEAERTTA